jgi:hypothetical protein
MLHQGKNSRYWVNLVGFARRWLNDPKAGTGDILNFEMYPFHSKGLKASIAPSIDLIDSFIWKPLLELKPNIAFAFGRDSRPRALVSAISTA